MVLVLPVVVPAKRDTVAGSRRVVNHALDLGITRARGDRGASYSKHSMLNGDRLSACCPQPNPPQTRPVPCLAVPARCRLHPTQCQSPHPNVSVR